MVRWELKARAGEAGAMGWGKSYAVRALGAVAALVFAVAPNQAFAYSATGDRLFPATLVLPQIAAGDEFYVNEFALPLNGGGKGTPSRVNNLTATYTKTITERLGLVVDETWTRLDL